jgi:hypothetical protein
MSTERKPTGDDATAMGQLKRLCRQNTALRDELFKLSDEMKSAVWRAEVKKRFGFWLSADSQVTRWRRWVLDLMDQDLLNDQMELRAERFKSENPGASSEDVRQDGILYFMEQARARGDGKLFLSVLDRDQTERHGKTKAELERQKLQLAERRVAVLENKVKSAQRVIEQAKKGGDGITKETLERIEKELRLL